MTDKAIIAAPFVVHSVHWQWDPHEPHGWSYSITRYGNQQHAANAHGPGNKDRAFVSLGADFKTFSAARNACFAHLEKMRGGPTDPEAIVEAEEERS